MDTKKLLIYLIIFLNGTLKINNMKGKIIQIDKDWMVEIQSDLHGYGIGWGDSKIYPLFITDEDIWVGKEVEVEPIQYDSNFIPVIVKIKEVIETTVVNTMPKNEDGKPFVNTMPMIETNKPSLKLYTEEQVREAISKADVHYHIHPNDIENSINSLKPIELPSDREIENNAYTDRRVEDLEYHEQIGFERGAQWMKQQILNQNK